MERFGNVSKLEDKERFKVEYQKQEQEKEDAYRFFAPLDLLLLNLRVILTMQSGGRRLKRHRIRQFNRLQSVPIVIVKI